LPVANVEESIDRGIARAPASPAKTEENMAGGPQSDKIDGSDGTMSGPAGNGSGGAITHGANSLSVVRKGSTGPRTRQGKEKSKHNALKHGIFANVVVLKGESQTGFDELLGGLREDFQPVGTFEEGLVETLAVTRWRQRRLLVAEGAEIQASRTFIEWDEKERQRIEAGNISAEPFNDGLIRKIASPEILKRCLDVLEEVKARIERKVSVLSSTNAAKIITRPIYVNSTDHRISFSGEERSPVPIKFCQPLHDSLMLIVSREDSPRLRNARNISWS